MFQNSTLASVYDQRAGDTYDAEIEMQTFTLTSHFTDADGRLLLLLLLRWGLVTLVACVVVTGFCYYKCTMFPQLFKSPS